MDARSFDALTARLGHRANRRKALLIAGLLPLLPRFVAAQTVVDVKQKCKPRCGVCERCNNGKCKPRQDGMPCSGVCNVCKAGLCTARCDADTTCLNGGCFRDCAGDPTAVTCLNEAPTGLCTIAVTGEPVLARALELDHCDEVEPCESDRDCLLGRVCAESSCCTAVGAPRFCVSPATPALPRT